MDKKSGFTSIKHGRIYYESYGKGLPIVMIHGGPGLSMDYFFPHLLDLKKNGEIIFYDQRGSGRSVASCPFERAA